MADEIERLRAELAAAKAAVQQRDSLLAIVAHELRNPMGPVMMGLEILVRELEDPTTEREALLRRAHQTERYVERLRSDLDRLLDFSRLQTGRIDLQRETFDLSALVTSALAELESLLAASHCELHLSLQQPIEGTWDRMRLRQIVWNLVSNAAKYAAGSRVDVSTSGDAERAVLVVRDHGPGIPASEHEAVFRQFERIQRSSHTGFGVGLWLVRQIVEALGGSIELDSTVGLGSTFTVTLPRNVT